MTQGIWCTAECWLQLNGSVTGSPALPRWASDILIHHSHIWLIITVVTSSHGRPPLHQQMCLQLILFCGVMEAPDVAGVA